MSLQIYNLVGTFSNKNNNKLLYSFYTLKYSLHKLFESMYFQIDGISVRGLSENQIVMLLNSKRISLSIRRYVPVMNGMLYSHILTL